MATSIADLQKLYGSNNLGKFKVYQSTGADAQYGNFLYIPAAGNFRGGYFNIDQATIDTLPQGSYEEGGPMLQRLEGGINRAAFSDALMGQITNGNMVNSGNQSFDNISNQVKDAIKMTKEVPTYTNETVVGATPSVPAGSAGAKLQAALKANPNLTPEQQLAASGGTTGGTTGGTATPAYKDAQGNVFDAQGNYISWDAIPKGADGKPIANLDILPVKEAPGGTTQTGVTGAQYLRQKGTNDVFAIVNGGAYYVPYDYAVANNVFSQVQEIDGRVDQKYPIAGNVSQLPTSGNNTQGGADLGQQGASQTIDPALKAFNEPTQDEIIANLKAMGISDETIAGMTPDNQSMFAALGESLKKQYEQDNPVPQTFTQADLDKIFADAQADPSINEYYKNQLRIGQETFGRTLSYLGAGYTAEQAATAMQQDQQRKQQADQFAQSGAAVSGFRTRAAEQLKSEQQNVITSSKRQLEQQLNQLGAGYEQQFGSSNLPQIGIGGVSYNPIGGVTGDIERQKLLDIQALNQQNINKSALTRGLTT